MTEKPNMMEGTVQLGSIRLTTAADSWTHQRAFTDTRAGSVPDLPGEVVRVQPGSPNSAYSTPEHERADNSSDQCPPPVSPAL